MTVERTKQAALRALLRFLLRFCTNPYRHLYHPDGSLYMQRLWVMPRFLLSKTFDEYGEYYKPKDWLPFALRLHRIETADLDPHCHDHPWWFFSWMLAGSYVEARPVGRDPCFFNAASESESFFESVRGPGSFAFRRSTDRHRIIFVMPGTWTLVLHGFPASQWWGFYTRVGKVYWREYPSVIHADAAAPRSER